MLEGIAGRDGLDGADGTPGLPVRCPLTTFSLTSYECLFFLKYL